MRIANGCGPGERPTGIVRFTWSTPLTRPAAGPEYRTVGVAPPMVAVNWSTLHCDRRRDAARNGPAGHCAATRRENSHVTARRCR